MDHLVDALVAERLLDVLRLGAPDPPQLARVVVHEAARELLAVRRSASATTSPARNSPSTSTRPDGSRLLPLSVKAFFAPGVNREPSLGRHREGDPPLARGEAVVARLEVGPHRLALEQPLEDPASRPLAITMGMPEAPAFCAASSLVLMPPTETVAARVEDQPLDVVGDGLDGLERRAPGSRRGSPV